MNLPEVTLELLKARFHYQEDYYNRLIKKNTGFTFSAYLQHLKIEKAKELLRVTSLSVHEIAQQMGYSDDAYFYRQFKKQTGVTPHVFRKGNQFI